ncbi:MAG TPA: MoaD/ThiS family protein [Vicinamibacterales bacterium]
MRVELPYHLRQLAGIDGDCVLDVPGVVTMGQVLDAIERRYPMLQGTIRDHLSGQRRPLLRFFACDEDISFAPLDAPLPEAVARGAEPVIVLGAIAGG